MLACAGNAIFDPQPVACIPLEETRVDHASPRVPVVRSTHPADCLSGLAFYPRDPGLVAQREKAHRVVREAVLLQTVNDDGVVRRCRAEAITRVAVARVTSGSGIAQDVFSPQPKDETEFVVVCVAALAADAVG